MGALRGDHAVVPAAFLKVFLGSIGLMLSAPLGAASPSIGMVQQQWVGSGAAAVALAAAPASAPDIATGRCKWDASGEDPAASDAPVLGILGSRLVGRTVDLADERCAQRVLEYAPDHTSVAWRNPSTGQSYSLTPLNSHREDDGAWCRDYVATIMTGSRAEDVHGAACRQDDGHWQGHG